MPPHRRLTHHERPVLRPEEEQRRARWSLLDALAAEYPETTEPLAAALPFYSAALAKHDNSAFAKLAVGQGLCACLEEDVDETSFIQRGPFGDLKFKPPALLLQVSLHIGKWALESGLLTDQGFYTAQDGKKVRILRPAWWVAEHAAEILFLAHTQLSSVAAAINSLANPQNYFSINVYEPTYNQAPYPERPEVYFSPKMESRNAFLERMAVKLEQYADNVVAWHLADGKQVSRARGAEAVHFRWLAWQLKEGLSIRKIGGRSADRGFDQASDPATVHDALRALRLQVFGSSEGD